MFTRVQALNVHRLAHTDPLIEEYYLVLRSQPWQRVRYLHIDLELDDLAQLTNRDIIWNVEAEEKLPKQLLFVDDLSVDWLDDDGQHGRVLEPEVFKLNLPLGCKRWRKRHVKQIEKKFVMIL